MDQPKMVTTSQAAIQLGIHPQTLRRWEREGVIPQAMRRRGRRLYTPSDVSKIREAIMGTTAHERKVTQS